MWCVPCDYVVWWWNGTLKCGKTGPDKEVWCIATDQVALKSDPFVANNSPHTILDSQLSREAHKVFSTQGGPTR